MDVKCSISPMSLHDTRRGKPGLKCMGNTETPTTREYSVNNKSPYHASFFKALHSEV